MKKIALILCLVLVASFVLSGCNNSDSIITLEDREVGKIEIQSGNTGETVEVTEEEVISQIADILSLEFEKGEKSNDSTGWSYSVRWYDTEGKQIDTVRIFRNMVSPTPCTNCLFRHATFYCNFRYYTRQISSPLFHPELISKQIAMRSRPYQFQNQSLPNNFIDQQPVRLDVTFSHVLIISGISESMISIRLRQRLLVTQQRDHFLQLLRIAASLDRKLVISFELPRKLRLKHSAPPSDLQRYQTDHTYPLPFLPPPSPHR